MSTDALLIDTIRKELFTADRFTTVAVSIHVDADRIVSLTKSFETTVLEDRSSMYALFIDTLERDAFLQN